MIGEHKKNAMSVLSKQKNQAELDGAAHIAPAYVKTGRYIKKDLSGTRKSYYNIRMSQFLLHKKPDHN